MGSVDCVLLNPAIDHVMEVNDFHAGGTFMSMASRIFPAGKAISVAVGLNALGNEPRVLAVVGKEEKWLYDEWLSGVGIDRLLFPVDGATRRHVTVVDPASGKTTHLREPGFRVDANVAGAVIDAVDASLVVLSGSFPPGLDGGAARQMVASLGSRGIKTVVDTSGEPLNAIAVDGRATAIRVNEQELEAITSGSEAGVEAIAKRAAELLHGDTSLVAVTRGQEGAILAMKDMVLEAWVDQVPAGKHRGGTVGAGDAFMAGLVDGLVKGRGLEGLARGAVAAATASLLAPGPGALAVSDRDAILPRVALRRLT